MFGYNFYKLFLYLCLIIIVIDGSKDSEFCDISKNSVNSAKSCGKDKYFLNKRYILYDVNPPEGFNLRRDVYVRVAVFLKNLVHNDRRFQWHLVLPPWGNLYHWRSGDVGDQNQIPWGEFFDIPSLNRFAPVIEMYEFLKEYKTKEKAIILDRVYILQNDPKMFETGKFQDKNEITECIKTRYYKNSEGKFAGKFWGYQNITSKRVECITFHGTMSNLVQNLKPDSYRSVMFDHMEIPLHDHYGSQDYWQARRSMRYNPALYKIASNFRKNYLESTDEVDKTKQPADWRQEKEQRNAIGGPYLAVHLRRRDFVTGRSNSVPTLKNAAFQLDLKMKEHELERIFIATDADNQEFEELKEYLTEYKVFRYTPSNYDKKKIKDGGIAIIDQIICSHARYFIGTHESTFTFRIQEDREIMGFPTSTTFNRLCGKQKNCRSSSQWEIVW